MPAATALVLIIWTVSSISARRSTSVSRSTSRPASILARSRMSLISDSRCCARTVDVAAIFRILLDRFGAHRLGVDDLRKAQNGVQRRAQFVAHIGEEFRLGAAGGFGAFARRIRSILGRLEFVDQSAAFLLQSKHALAGRVIGHQQRAHHQPESGADPSIDPVGVHVSAAAPAARADRRTWRLRLWRDGTRPSSSSPTACRPRSAAAARCAPALPGTHSTIAIEHQTVV